MSNKARKENQQYWHKCQTNAGSAIFLQNVIGVLTLPDNRPLDGNKWLRYLFYKSPVKMLKAFGNFAYMIFHCKETFKSSSTEIIALNQIEIKFD